MTWHEWLVGLTTLILAVVIGFCIAVLDRYRRRLKERYPRLWCHWVQTDPVTRSLGDPLECFWVYDLNPMALMSSIYQEDIHFDDPEVERLRRWVRRSWYLLAIVIPPLGVPFLLWTSRRYQRLDPEEVRRLCAKEDKEGETGSESRPEYGGGG